LTPEATMMEGFMTSDGMVARRLPKAAMRDLGLPLGRERSDLRDPEINVIGDPMLPLPTRETRGDRQQSAVLQGLDDRETLDRAPES
jgi:hypothetical protein